MASSEVWDVVKVPFLQQYRPALVVAQHRAPGSPALLWVLMITSASHRRWHGDVEISDLFTAGLPVPSIVRTAKIAIIEGHDAGTIGSLPKADRPAVRGQIAGLLTAVLGLTS